MLGEIVIAVLLVLGGGFALVGSWGLVRLPSMMSRLHGPTKATTLGVGSCLIASMIYFPLFGGQFSIHELLITLFLFITAPVSANMIAKAHLHRLQTGGGLRATVPAEENLPSPGEASGWATIGPNAQGGE